MKLIKTMFGKLINIYAIDVIYISRDKDISYIYLKVRGEKTSVPFMAFESNEKAIDFLENFFDKYIVDGPNFSVKIDRE